jgi:predicted nucleotidyltransferase
MKTVGIIAEYNPFHNGHAFQLAEVRRSFGADAAVVVAMSGDFTQRGEPAIVDKWVRAESALRSGVDLVLEIPFAYAAASAERFAQGGVSLLAATGVCGRLAFGSESGSLEALHLLADVLVREPEGYRLRLRESLDEGFSFPAARQAALAAYLSAEGLSGDAALLERPNDILAVEYLKAVQRVGERAPVPFAVQRTGAGYHDTVVPAAGSGGQTLIASASALRAAFLAPLSHESSSVSIPVSFPVSSLVDRDGLGSAFEAIRRACPPASAGALLEAAVHGLAPVTPEAFAPLLLSMLRSLPVDRLDHIAYMGEGLSRRLKAAAAEVDGEPCHAGVGAGLYASLTAHAATRRFPSTRIARALAALAVGLTDEDLALFDAAGGPRYLRVLGFTKKGRYLLKKMRASATLPIFTKTSDFLEHGDDPVLQRMGALDLAAADLHRLHVPEASRRRCGSDFDTPVLML